MASNGAASVGGARTLAWAAVGGALAVGLAIAAAHWYEVPKLAGTPDHSVWTERDFLCSAASGAVALTLSALTRRSATRAGAAAGGSLFLRALLWAGLSLVFLGIWAAQLGLFTLWVAPTHALAATRLFALWSKWRSDQQWSRLN